MPSEDKALHDLFKLLFQAHPWHGVSAGEDAPDAVSAYIEIVPTDAVKYELDKTSGHLLVDRPQRFSSMCPTLYGFIPQTFCGDNVGKLCGRATGRAQMQGDGDPMDICVLTEKNFAHGSFFLRAKPIGGLRMTDGEQADDKIIAVLDSDLTYGQIADISSCPTPLVDRLKHYFLSYKQFPGEASKKVEIAGVYDRTEALNVINESMTDYRATFGDPENRIHQLRQLVSTD